jgi:catechol 2,3-dioxygenase-like lactoylglutathione lyase family enzyme
MRRTVVLLLLMLSPLMLYSLAAQQTPNRPKIFGIEAVQISASDMHAAHDFYSKVLNRPEPLAMDKATGSGLHVNDSQIVILTTTSSSSPVNSLGEIAFATSDVRALRRYLEFHKVDVSASNDAKDKYLTVVDPEGHRISFVEWSTDLIKQVDAKPPSVRLIHAGFVVRNRAAEDRFFKDILGFHLYWHGGMKDDKDDWVAMQVPDGTDWVEYMLNISPDADKHTLGVMNHFALGVPDIQAAKAQLIKNGWKPGEEPKIGRDGKWQLNLYDPDDTRVEFMEFTPKEKPCCSEFTGPHPGPKQ